LVPERLQAEASVASLIEMEQALQLAQFEAFWQKAKDAEIRPILDAASSGKGASFDDAVRGFIAKVLQRTYGSIEPKRFAALLCVKESDVAAQCAKLSAAGSGAWCVDKGMVLPPATQDNRPRGTVIPATDAASASVAPMLPAAVSQAKYADFAHVIRTLSTQA
jgi:hypothetical protein